MDEKTFKDRVKRLQEVSVIIEKLDPSIRAEAFSILQPYVTESIGRARHGSGNKMEADGGSIDAEAFFSQHTGKKPADNATIVAAFLYSEYGSEPFSLDEIREAADNAGVTIPERLDMTILQAQRAGKSLFRRAGKGQFKPTVHGESYFKTTLGVTKGRKKRQTEAQS